MVKINFFYILEITKGLQHYKEHYLKKNSWVFITTASFVAR